jgi:DNA-binding MarR family transcriptional regulator
MARPDVPVAGAAFLIAQLGAHAAEQFARRLAEHGLTPPQAGILRLIMTSENINQQALAERLGILPSRVVAFIDDLERRELIRRERDSSDRRANVLVLTDAGRSALRSIRTVASAHDKSLCAALDDDERAELVTLLSKMAAAEGLTPGVHPGYRSIAR